MKKNLIQLFVITLTLLFVSCENNIKPSKNTSSSPENIVQTITVGVHSWPGGGPVYIGDKLGYFKDENINLIIKKIENFDTKRASLISGVIDIDIANTMDQLLIYNENNFPAQIIGISDESVGGDGLVVNEEITTFSDLNGKTIAYAEASPSDFFLRYILSKNGIEISNVNFRPVSDPQIAGNAIIAKQVDAAVTYEPYLSQAENSDGIKILSSTKDYPTLIPGLLLANSNEVVNNVDKYKSFMRAWYKSVNYYYSNKSEAEKIIAKGMGMELSEVQDILSAVEIQTKENNIKLIDPVSEDNLYELVEKISDFWKKNNFVTKDFNASKLINKELISM